MDDSSGKDSLLLLFRRLCTDFKAAEAGTWHSAENGKVKLKSLIAVLESFKNKVDSCGIISFNEDVDDIPTSHLQFLLIPYLIGKLYMLETDAREKALLSAHENFSEFLGHLRILSLTDCCTVQLQHAEGSEAARSSHGDVVDTLLTAEKSRQEKIKIFKCQQELENQLGDFSLGCSISPISSEQQRELQLLELKLCSYKAVDELKAISDELPLVRRRKQMQATQGEAASVCPSYIPYDDRPPGPLKPFIITRTEKQKQVFGSGYPALPSMTVNEWYEQRMKNHSSRSECPVQNGDCAAGDSDQEDPEELKKLRDFDEYKDNHRTGWGNTYNKG